MTRDDDYESCQLCQGTGVIHMSPLAWMVRDAQRATWARLCSCWLERVVSANDGSYL